MPKRSTASRREFLTSASCTAWVLGLAALAPTGMRQAFAQTAKRKVLAKEKFGRLEAVADNVWALISTPFESRDFTTVSNGGIIAGKDRVVAIEGLNRPQGAKWLAERAKQLTGRWPTDVIVTHYHSDHSAGAVGYEVEGSSTNLWLTKKTKELIKTKNNRNGEPKLLKTIKEIKADAPTKIDLGGREILISTHAGHTASDVTIEIKEPNVLFCGDLFFNKLIPNYMDALPGTLKKTVASFKREKETLYVPGHGAIASPSDLQLYGEFLSMMEDTARATHKAGKEAASAAKEFKLPKKFADWYIFSPQVVPRVFAAWYREFWTKK